jgi:hypothetical protein
VGTSECSPGYRDCFLFSIAHPLLNLAEGNHMNRSKNYNRSEGSYSSSPSGLPNSVNRNFNNLNRDNAYRSDYQPHYDENYDEVQHGRDHEDQNQDQSLRSYRNQHNPQAGSRSENQYPIRSGQYPSTTGSRDSYSQPWQGRPSANSAYGSEWNSIDSESHAGKGPKNYKRSDERIHEDVSEALMHAHHVDASEIEVDVKDGIVVLSGSVQDRKTKRAAEECVESCSGVQDVKNNLSIARPGFFTNLMTKDEKKDGNLQ